LELNWSTFALEIINFLVLVWILKRFLYQPVLEVIARRRAGIDQTRADAEALHQNAEQLQEQYEGRLADWDKERQQARETLSEELEAERTTRMTELQTSLEQNREKIRVAQQRQLADERRKMEMAALAQGARFTTRLLETAAGPDVEARLVDLAITELGRLPPERIAEIREQQGRLPETIVILSAFPLASGQRQQLEQALKPLTPPNLPLEFRQSSALLAGVRVTIGAWVLDANLQAELRGFTNITQGV
jgi:F-type H+-transporting ATPase subunit b